MILIGVFIIINTISKPRYFWEHRKAVALRQWLGDRNATIIYLVLGGALLVVGVLLGVLATLNILAL
ncbi:MAG: hypothetical protein K0S71_1512 [Clostridia bacterium]|jgi:hypothetical protein|nr:hypothetical protein [Clostridia bacterium]